MPRAGRSILGWTGALLCACAADGAIDRVPDGAWGGDHVSVTVEAAGARVEFDCAHGAATAPLALDSKGRFDVPGYFVEEHGGPVREEEDDRRPARYSGTADEREIRFRVRLTEEGTTLGPFTATLGKPAQLVKCLSHLQP